MQRRFLGERGKGAGLEPVANLLDRLGRWGVDRSPVVVCGTPLGRNRLEVGRAIIRRDTEWREIGCKGDRVVVAR